VTATNLIIWRHGNTDWNRESRVQGSSDVPLNDRGVAQARAAASALAALRPDVIVSSDLKRAWDTASALADLTGLAVSTDDRLRERYFGRWQGQLMTDIQRDHPAEHAAWVAGDPDPGCDIEPRDQLAARASAGFADAAAMAAGGTVVVVSHGGTAKHGVAALLGWGDELLSSIAGLDNCAWARLQQHPRGWQLKSYNTRP